MRLRSISGARLAAVASAAPAHQLGHDNFAMLYGAKEAERVAKGTGIGSVRTVASLRTSDLIVAACGALVEDGALDPAGVDAVIVVTQTPDSWSPGTGFVVHEALGLGQDCLVLDASMGCSGYVTGLVQAAALVSSGACRRVLLCTGDVTSQLVNDGDRHVRMLFGDAASATVVEAGTAQDRIDCMTGADSSGRGSLGTGIAYSRDAGGDVALRIGGLHMDGTAVMNFALARVPAMVKSLMRECGVGAQSLSFIALHQANGFMLNYLRRMIGVGPDKVPIDVDGFGNTSSSSIPLLLSRHAATGTPDAAQVLLCGFGAGLSWAAARVDLSATRALPTVLVPDAH